MENQKPNEKKYLGKSESTIKIVMKSVIKETSFIFTLRK